VPIRNLIRVLLPRQLFTRNRTETVTAFKSPHLELNYPEAEAEAEEEAEAYGWQPAGTVIPGIGPRWDPWPYIYSMSRLLFSSFVDPPY
jgi:hypothetical protein